MICEPRFSIANYFNFDSITAENNMSLTFVASTANRRALGEQARGLRSLVAAQSNGRTSARPTRRCHTIVVSGGKGGVGRSVIAVNLAVAFAGLGSSVGLIDASPSFGNVEFLCGLNGYWNLSHVAQGCRDLNDVVLNGPAGIRILSGAGGLTDHKLLSAETALFDRLTEFERDLDWLIVDASGGGLSFTHKVAAAADDLLIIAIPEATAVAEAYATTKAFATTCGPRLGLMVNQANSEQQAQQILDRLRQAADSFLRIDLFRRGYILADPVIPESVNRRRPFVLASPDSASSVALCQLARRWTRQPASELPFFTRIKQAASDAGREGGREN